MPTDNKPTNNDTPNENNEAAETPGFTPEDGEQLFEATNTPPEGYPTLTPEESQRVKDLRDALLSEFRDNATKTGAASALEDIEDLKPDFLNALRKIVKFSNNESLQAKVAMWGYGVLVDQGKASRDPLADLISEMPQRAPVEHTPN